MKIKEPHGFIYITTNINNGKRYIGQRIFSNGWKTYLGSGVMLKNAIKKYGRESFIRDIVAVAYSEDELNELEIEWINNYNAVESDDFYNIASGGKSGNAFAGKSEKEMNVIKDKLSKARKGENNYNYGNTLSQEHKDKISKSMKGENNYGSIKVICLNTMKIFDTLKDGAQYYTNKNRAGLSLHLQGKQKHFGELKDGTPLVWEYYNIFLKMSKKEIENKINCAKIIDTLLNKKKIICITTRIIFESISDGAKLYNVDVSGISKNCKNLSSHCGKLEDGTKLVWVYHEEYLNLSKEEIDKKVDKLNCINKNKHSKSIICTTTENIFKNQKEAGKFYNIKSYKRIFNCCNDKSTYCGRLKDGTKLIWKYISDLTSEEYIKYDIENKLKEMELSNEDSPLLCKK